MYLQISTKTLRFLQPLYFSFQVGMFEDATLATPHSASPVWLTRWLTPTHTHTQTHTHTHTHTQNVTHREVIRLYGVCCRRYGWHPRPFWNATSSYAHKALVTRLPRRPRSVLRSWVACNFVLFTHYWALSQNCGKRISASSCLSVRPHGKTRLPLDGIFIKFNILLSIENVERTEVSLKSNTYNGYLT